jgi:hypothetical protein
MKVGALPHVELQPVAVTAPQEKTLLAAGDTVCRRAAEGYSHSVSPRRRAWLLLAAGSVLLLFSAAVLVHGRRPADSFGWYAYAPLSDTAFPSGFVFLDPTQWGAIAVAIVGLVAAGWAAGFLAGRGAR